MARQQGAHISRAALRAELRRAREAYRRALLSAAAAGEPPPPQYAHQAAARGFWRRTAAERAEDLLVFTVLTGGYDGSAPAGRLAGWEHVTHLLLTDAARGLHSWRAAGWEVRAVRTGAPTARLAAKALKFASHRHLPPGARYALYVDATVRSVSWRPEPLLDICRRTGALWLLTPHGLHLEDPYDEAFRVAQLQLDTEENALATAAALAAARFPRRWPGPFAGGVAAPPAAAANASHQTSLTESVVSFRDLRAPLLRLALEEVRPPLEPARTITEPCLRCISSARVHRCTTTSLRAAHGATSSSSSGRAGGTRCPRSPCRYGCTRACCTTATANATFEVVCTVQSRDLAPPEPSCTRPL